MRRLVYFLAIFISCSTTYNNIKSPPKPTPEKQKLTVIMLDGVRRHEFFHWKYYRFLKSKATYILGRRRSCSVNNPAYISLPGYSDILAGKRQNVNSNRFKGKLRHPTIVDMFDNNRMFLLTYWYKIKAVVSKYKKQLPLHTLEPHRFVPGRFYDYKIYKYAYDKLNAEFNFVIFSDADTAAHKHSYGAYLKKLRYQNLYIRRLYEKYPNHIFIVSTDHGRGYGRYKGVERWKHHGRWIPKSKYIWAAIITPKKYEYLFDKLRRKCDHIEIGQVIIQFLKTNQ